MLIKFFRNGKGAGAGPVGYLIANRVLAYDDKRDLIRDPDGQPLTVTRKPLPEVLRGNPERTEALIDASRHQWTYRSGVISFAAADAPTEEQQGEVIDHFERLAFAGLDPEQYEVLWVRHTHEDRVELHFCTPRLELTSSRSLNIAPPGYQQAFDSLRDVMNQRHGWADPMELERTQEVRDIIEPPTRAKGRDEIHTWLQDQVSVGFITDRTSMLDAVIDAGFNIPRTGKAYLTVLDPDTGERWRLKGKIFHEDWQADSAKRKIERGTGHDQAGLRRLDGITTGELQNRLKQHCDKRAAYNRNRYAHLSTKEQELADDFALVDRGDVLGGDRLDNGRKHALDANAVQLKADQARANSDQQGGWDLACPRPSPDASENLHARRQSIDLHPDRGGLGDKYPDSLRTRLARLRRAVGDCLRSLRERFDRLEKEINQRDRDAAEWLSALYDLTYSLSGRVADRVAWLAQRRSELQLLGQTIAEEFALSEGRRRKAHYELACRSAANNLATTLFQQWQGASKGRPDTSQPNALHSIKIHHRHRALTRYVAARETSKRPKP